MKVYLEVYPDCVEVCAPDMPHGSANRYRHVRNDWTHSTAAQGTIRKDLQDAYAAWCGGTGQPSPADHEIVILIPEVTARAVARTEEFRQYCYENQTALYDIVSPDNPNGKYGLSARFYGHEILVIPAPSFSEVLNTTARKYAYEPNQPASKGSYIPSGEFPGKTTGLWTTTFTRIGELFKAFEESCRPLYEKHPSLQQSVEETQYQLERATKRAAAVIEKDLTAAAKSIEEASKTIAANGTSIFIPPPPGKKFVLNEKFDVELTDDPDADPQPTIVNGAT